jgi:hypothetical protein
LHSLCPVRALKYYLARSKSVRKEGVSRLFVTLATGRQGHAIASLSTGRWLTDLIGKAYVHYGRTPAEVKAHSTRVVSTLRANLRGAQIQDIYNAATGASGHAFVKHYRRDVVNDNMSSISSHVWGAARPLSGPEVAQEKPPTFRSLRRSRIWFPRKGVAM